jgi:3-oxoacyl-[acyl-carrier protein] reductase
MLREELRKYKIGVSVIYPGPVFTDEWKGTTIPKEKFIKAEDIGRIVHAAIEMSSGASMDEIIVNTMIKEIRYD